MRSAIERPIRAGALDLLIVELAHRRRRHELVECRRRQFAIVIVGAAEIDEHVALRLVVADALNEAAPRCVCAGERLQVDDTAVLDVDCFRTRGRGDQDGEGGCDISDHDG
jgi:hypothetical protein